MLLLLLFFVFCFCFLISYFVFVIVTIVIIIASSKKEKSKKHLAEGCDKKAVKIFKFFFFYSSAAKKIARNLNLQKLKTKKKALHLNHLLRKWSEKVFNSTAHFLSQNSVLGITLILKKLKNKTETDAKSITAEAIHSEELEVLQSDFKWWSGAVQREGRYDVVVERFPLGSNDFHFCPPIGVYQEQNARRAITLVPTTVSDL